MTHKRSRRRRGRARIGADTVLEMRNPIPVGVYWVDLEAPPGSMESPAHEFRIWAADNSESVQVVKREMWTESGARAREWSLFKVTAPTQRWDDETGIGRPTVATKNVAPSSAVPDFEARRTKPIDVPKAAKEAGKEIVKGLGSGLGLLLLLWALTKKE